MRSVFAGIAVGLAIASTANPAPAQTPDALAAAEASNMEIIGRSDLNGAGKGGEGLALNQYPDGRRVLFPRP